MSPVCNLPICDSVPRRNIRLTPVRPEGIWRLEKKKVRTSRAFANTLLVRQQTLNILGIQDQRCMQLKGYWWAELGWYAQYYQLDRGVQYSYLSYFDSLDDGWVELHVRRHSWDELTNAGLVEESWAWNGDKARKILWLIFDYLI